MIKRLTRGSEVTGQVKKAKILKTKQQLLKIVLGREIVLEDAETKHLTVFEMPSWRSSCNAMSSLTH